MVSTRHRRDSDDALPFMGTRYHNSGKRAKIPRVLRNLEIDGNDGLRGERDGKSQLQQQVKVYHWRGAVYAVDENTPEEWIEAQPKRYLKRKREEQENEDDEDDDDDDYDSSGDDESREESDSDDDESEDDDDDEEEPPAKRRATSRPARKLSRSAPQPRAKSARRASNTPVSSRTHARSSPVRPPTPQSAPIRRPRGRPPKSGQSKQASVTSTRRVAPSNVTPQWRQGYGQPVSRKTEQARANLQPISWADMTTGSIAVHLTRFLAVQKQLRKLHHDYALARDLHARVLAREDSKVKVAVAQKKDTNSDVIMLGSRTNDGKRLQVGSAVERTDSRMSRREEQIFDTLSDTRAGATASDDGGRDRASSFDTAPSQAATPAKNYVNLHTSSPNTSSTFQRIAKYSTHDGVTTMGAFLHDDNRAESSMLVGKMNGTETPEEKSRRMYREWDTVMGWPRKTI